MGCSHDPTNNYWTAYKHMFTHTDIQKLTETQKVYLIKVNSLPNFMNIISKSKILKKKNISDQKSLQNFENSLSNAFENYREENNAIIYHNFRQLKSIIEDNYENNDEFIIVNEIFLDKLNITGKNEYSLLKWNQDKAIYEINFLNHENNLGFEEVEPGIFKFIFNENNEHSSDNGKTLVLKNNRLSKSKNKRNNRDYHYNNKKSNEDNESNNKNRNKNNNAFNIAMNNINIATQANLNEYHENINKNDINVFHKNQEFNKNQNILNDKQQMDNNQMFINNDMAMYNQYNINNNNIYKAFNNIQIKQQQFNNNENGFIIKEISNFIEPPLIGLMNIELNSYMNATLQCLSNINKLTDFFLCNKNYFLNIQHYSSEKPISKAFSDILYHLWNPNEPNKYYTTNYFIDILRSKYELDIKKIDSKDLLLFLYENIHKELNGMTTQNILNNENFVQKNEEDKLMKSRQNFYRENKSIIIDLFYFEEENAITCLNCQNKISNFAMYNMLIFSLEKMNSYKLSKNNNNLNLNINDCLECHTNAERNQLGDTIYCHKCQQNVCYLLENKISSYPEILTIVLSRANKPSNSIYFSFDYTLDNLDDYMIKLNCNKKDLGTKYELIGIIIRTWDKGKEGHFLSYCKSPVDKNWYCYDDINVKKSIDPIKEIRVIPYILFYQKICKCI